MKISPRGRTRAEPMGREEYWYECGYLLLPMTAFVVEPMLKHGFWWGVAGTVFGFVTTAFSLVLAGWAIEERAGHPEVKPWAVKWTRASHIVFCVVLNLVTFFQFYTPGLWRYVGPPLSITMMVTFLILFVSNAYMNHPDGIAVRSDERSGRRRGPTGLSPRVKADDDAPKATDRHFGIIDDRLVFIYEEIDRWIRRRRVQDYPLPRRDQDGADDGGKGARPQPGFYDTDVDDDPPQL